MFASKYSLTKKMIFLSFFSAIITLGVGSTAFIFFNKVTHQFDEVVDLTMPKMQLTYDMLNSYQKVRISLRTLGIDGITIENTEQNLKEAQNAIAEFEIHKEAYIQLGFSEKQKELFVIMAANWENFKKIGSEIAILSQNKTPESVMRLHEIFLNVCPEHAEKFKTSIEILRRYHEDSVSTKVSTAKASETQGKKIILGIIAAGLSLGFTIGFILSRKVSKSISDVSFSLGQGSDVVALAANQISDSAQTISQAAVEQAASVEETVATMEELSSIVQKNNINANKAAELSSLTHASATQGEREILTLIDSIQSIAADSKKIEAITTIIDDIAFQTNLLALNASVEAARAGEQGKGFAIVAEAVRGLAQRSAVAAKDIAELIKASVNKIETSSKQVVHSGDTLTKIVSSTKTVAEINKEIVVASSEQTAGIVQINKAMHLLDQTTQANAAAAEQASAAAEELSAQSLQVQHDAHTLEKVVMGA